MMLDPSLMPPLGAGLWQKLYAFYYVAGLKSYSRAAACLNLSQSSVSRAVQALEDRFKTVLVLRKRGGSLALTEQGQRTFEQLQGMVADLACLTLGLEQAPLKAQALSLKISPWLLSDYYIDALLSFKKGWVKGGLKVYTATALNDKMEAAFDVNIGWGLIPHQALVQKLLFRVSLAYYASQSYLNTEGAPSNLTELANYLIYEYSPTQALFKHPLGSLCDKNILIPSSTCLVKIAEAGVGIIRFVKDHPCLRASSLVRILEDCSEVFEERSVYFCCSKATWERQEVQFLYRFLKLYLKS